MFSFFISIVIVFIGYDYFKINDCIVQTLFYYYFFKAPPVVRPAQSPSGGGSFIIPQPSKRSPAKQPVSDLLGDLGGDPFAQSAGKSTLHMCQHYWLTYSFHKGSLYMYSIPI